MAIKKTRLTVLKLLLISSVCVIGGCSDSVSPTNTVSESPVSPVSPPPPPPSSVRGEIISETSAAFPSSWAYKRMVFPEGHDSIECSDAVNDTASLGKVFLAQTHVMEPEWPFFHLSSGRPALLEVAVTGSGGAPSVKVEAEKDGTKIGELCLSGPDILPQMIDAEIHQRSDRFTVTLPSEWIDTGLSLTVSTGSQTRSFSAETLGVRPTADMTLTIFDLEIMDYLDEEARALTDEEDFIEAFAESTPGSSVRVGRFPHRIKLPSIAVHGTGDEPLILIEKENLQDVPDLGNVNAAASEMLSSIQRALGIYPFSVTFGHTGELAPGGWGGDRSFVSPDYTDVFIHEFGHASGNLLHWGETFDDGSSFRFPYQIFVGQDETGRGNNWNYKQSQLAYVSPLCENPEAGADAGIERQDAMQRRAFCPYYVRGEQGRWDGFSDFSTHAIYRFLTGDAQDELGTVPYLGRNESYKQKQQRGLLFINLGQDGEPVLTVNDLPDRAPDDDTFDFVIPDKWNANAYLVYGSYHPEFDTANILYDPIEYTGTLPKLVDPTDPAVFEILLGEEIYGGHFDQPRDLVFVVTYQDGSQITSLSPHSKPTARETLPSNEQGAFRTDITRFAIALPREQTIARIEVFRRDFIVRKTDETIEGNIIDLAQNITAANFMDKATLILSRDFP